MDDPFIQGRDASELDIAGEFLTNWLPLLTRNLCPNCSQTLTHRIRSLRPDQSPQIEPYGADTIQDPKPEGCAEHVVATGWGTDPDPDPYPEGSGVRKSWADMAEEVDELAMAERSDSEETTAREGGGKKKVELSRGERELYRFGKVGRMNDFICLERVKGRITNILEGLELHTGVISAAEQKRIVDFVYELQEKGRRSELAERTYSEPQKWMRGKGRVTIQFGCCYNYALDKDGNPPGILRNAVPDPLPNLFKVIIRRLVRWHVLPTSCVPDSCIVNIYEPGDCIPPHIDSHDFVRPFSTVSFLSECDILFGTNLKIEGAGEFSGSTAISLPVGSVLVLNGNGADVAKHCVPAVPTKRISITFRKMDESKIPNGFKPEPDLQNIQPLHEENSSSGKQPRTASRSRTNGSKHIRTPGGTQQQPHNSESATPSVRSRQVIDARSISNGSGLLGRAPGSAERPSRHQSYDPEMTPHTARPRQAIDVRSATNSSGSRSRSSSQDTRRLREADVEPIQRSRQQDWSDDAEVESGRRRDAAEVESGRRRDAAEVESGRRRVSVNQKRIVISRNVEGEEMPSTGSQSIERTPHSRRVVNTRRMRVKVVLGDDEWE